MSSAALRRVALGALVVSIAVHVAVARSSTELWAMIDLDVYRWGGHLARHSDDLYGSTYAGFLGFTYPPFAAALFIPLASVPWTVLRALVLAGNLALLVAAVWVTLGWLGHGRDRSRFVATAALAAVFIWLEPVQQTLKFGQVNLLVMVIVLADLRRDDTRRTKGLGIGLVTGLKLTPMIFVAYLVLTRRLRAAAVAVATFGATIIAGFAVLPRESRDFWFDRLFLDSERVGNVAYVANQSLHGAVVRRAGGVDAGEMWWLATALVVGCGGLALAAWAGRAGSDLLGVLLCALTGLLVSPISWSHHWVWAVPALAACAHLAHARRSRMLGAAAVAVTFAVAAWPVPGAGGAPALPRGVIWLAPYNGDQEYGWSVVQSLAGNLYVIAGIGLLLTAAADDLLRRREHRS